jgi:hypothetical protein
MIYKNIKLFLQNFRQYQTQSRRRIRERSGRKRRYYHLDVIINKIFNANIQIHRYLE